MIMMMMVKRVMMVMVGMMMMMMVMNLAATPRPSIATERTSSPRPPPACSTCRTIHDRAKVGT
jgi:hypothetical protein